MKLLTLAPSFPDKDDKFYGGIFVKEQVKALSKYVDEINVISPIPRSFGKLYEEPRKVGKEGVWSAVDNNDPTKIGTGFERV